MNKISSVLWKLGMQVAIQIQKVVRGWDVWFRKLKQVLSVHLLIHFPLYSEKKNPFSCSSFSIVWSEIAQGKKLKICDKTRTIFWPLMGGGPSAGPPGSSLARMECQPPSGWSSHPWGRGPHLPQRALRRDCLPVLGVGGGERVCRHTTAVHWRPLELSAEGCSRKEDIYGLPPFQLVPTDVTVHGHRKDRKLRCRHAGRTREISSLVSDNQPVFSSPVFSITVGKSALHLHWTK